MYLLYFLTAIIELYRKTFKSLDDSGVRQQDTNCQI